MKTRAWHTAPAWSRRSPGWRSSGGPWGRCRLQAGKYQWLLSSTLSTPTERTTNITDVRIVGGLCPLESNDLAAAGVTCKKSTSFLFLESFSICACVFFSSVHLCSRWTRMPSACLSACFSSPSRISVSSRFALSTTACSSSNCCSIVARTSVTECCGVKLSVQLGRQSKNVDSLRFCKQLIR